MKTKTAKIVCTLAVCVLAAGTVSARPHHHGGGKDLHRAAAIVDIVTNSLIGLSVLSGNAAIVTPAPVYVAPPPPPPPRPVYIAPPPPPRPVYVAPPRRHHYRPAPPPPRRHHAPAHRGGGHRGGRR